MKVKKTKLNHRRGHGRTRTFSSQVNRRRLNRLATYRGREISSRDSSVVLQNAKGKMEKGGAVNDLFHKIQEALLDETKLQAWSEQYPDVATQFIPLAKEVLESPDNVILWIQQPLLALDNQRPIDLLLANNLSPVMDELYRIEYGVHSFF